MHLLITAGVTQVPIDRVRVITSIFSGRTGTRIALTANRRGHQVTLLTSAPHLVGEQLASRAAWHVRVFRTYEELEQILGALVPSGQFDAIIHSAAISDYRVAGIYVRTSAHAAASQLTENGRTSSVQNNTIFTAPPPVGEYSSWWPTDEVLGKLPSSHEEVWLRLVPTPKLIDRMRRDWGFAGVLVKFKLECGVSEQTLLARAEQSRQRSAADLMVANLLESLSTTAWLGPLDGSYRRLPRSQLADVLLDAVESLHARASR